MKKIICIIFALMMLASLFGCGSSSDKKTAQVNQAKSVNDVLNEKINENSQTTSNLSDQASKSSSDNVKPVYSGTVDVDLTRMSSTVVYSEVYNMMTSPENYMGKRVRMNGTFACTEGDGRYYFACLISDATACCSQGIEFILSGGKSYPEDYPEKGAEITVTGVFDTYYEGQNRYCQLIDAVME